MNADVIPFPLGRERSDQAEVAPDGALFLPQEEAEPFAEVVIGLRQLLRPTRAFGTVEQRLTLDRCVAAGLRGLSLAGGRIRLAGSSERPVLEASFEGDDASLQAVRGVSDADALPPPPR